MRNSRKIFLAFFFISIVLTSFGQLKKVVKLPAVLNECSGMFFLNDSTLIMHNDSESPAKLYAVSLSGKIQSSWTIKNKLTDFEAITHNGNILYLADIGNNYNLRKDLKIISFDLSKLQETKTSISYNEQIAFPPTNDQLYFDAEAICYKNDSLYLFTKNRTKRFDGVSYVYGWNVIDTTPTLVAKLALGKGSWMTKSITDVCFYNATFYVLTYRYLFILNNRFEIIQKHRFDHLAQREAIAINSKGEIYIATEKHPLLGGGKLYQLILK